MDSMQRRPLGTFAFVFFVSLCFMCAADGGVWLALPMLAVFAALLFVRVRIPYRRAFALTAAGVLAASLYFGIAVELRISRAESLAGQTRDTVYTVTDVRYTSSREGCYTVSDNGMKLILYSEECELKRGDIIRCSVTYGKLDESGGSREYLLSQGILLTAETSGDVELVGQRRSIGMMFGELREHLSERLKSAMSEREGGFAAALVLGDRRSLDGGITRDFRALGISHILAVSGTHLGVLFFSVGKLIPERHRRLRAVILCPLVIFYMLLTGMPSSVVRAGAMTVLASLAYAVSKRNDPFTTLSVAAAVICLADPTALFDVGLQLSFASVLGLVISSELSRRIVKGKSRPAAAMIRLLVPSVTVPAVILPLMWLRFGEISLISPVANIALVPVATVLVPLIAAALMLSWINGLFIALSSGLCLIISAFLWVVNAAASVVDAVLPLVGTVTSVTVILFTVAAVAAVLLWGRLRSIFGSAALVLLGATLLVSQIAVCRSNSGLTVCYAAASRDEAVCAVSDGCSILVDAGRYPAAAGDAAESGAAHGSGRLDALILSHLHESHCMTLASVLSEYYVYSVWMPAVDDAELAKQLAAVAEEYGAAVYMYLPGEVLRFGDCKFVCPISEKTDDSVHGSLSFELICGDGVFSYGASPADAGYLGIAATHGVNLSGDVIGKDFEGYLMAPKGASAAESVTAGAVICDSAIIHFDGGPVPSVSYPQE